MEGFFHRGSFAPISCTLFLYFVHVLVSFLTYVAISLLSVGIPLLFSDYPLYFWKDFSSFTCT